MEIAYSANDRGQLQVFDAQGRIVHAANLLLTQSQRTEIDLSELPDGIYTILWRGAEANIVNKLIKQ